MMPNLFSQPSTQRWDELEATPIGVPASPQVPDEFSGAGQEAGMFQILTISSWRRLLTVSQSKVRPVNFSRYSPGFQWV